MLEYEKEPAKSRFFFMGITAQNSWWHYLFYINCKTL